MEAFSRARFFWNSSSTRRIASSSLNRIASLISASRDSFSATRRFSICRIVLWNVNRWLRRLDSFTGKFSSSLGDSALPSPDPTGTGSCRFSLSSRRTTILLWRPRHQQQCVRGPATRHSASASCCPANAGVALLVQLLASAAFRGRVTRPVLGQRRLAKARHWLAVHALNAILWHIELLVEGGHAQNSSSVVRRRQAAAGLKRGMSNCFRGSVGRSFSAISCWPSSHELPVVLTRTSASEEATESDDRNRLPKLIDQLHLRVADLVRRQAIVGFQCPSFAARVLVPRIVAVVNLRFGGKRLRVSFALREVLRQSLVRGRGQAAVAVIASPTRKLVFGGGGGGGGVAGGDESRASAASGSSTRCFGSTSSHSFSDCTGITSAFVDADGFPFGVDRAPNCSPALPLETCTRNGDFALLAPAGWFLFATCCCLWLAEAVRSVIAAVCGVATDVGAKVSLRVFSCAPSCSRRDFTIDLRRDSGGDMVGFAFGLGSMARLRSSPSSPASNVFSRRKNETGLGRGELLPCAVAGCFSWLGTASAECSCCWRECACGGWL
uniref:Uncharacterized protein n=1 Tax=Anopheles atroparvus TaxID=41427 RepID=A0A182IY53_ANOAO